MEPQENLKISLQKAVSAHEQAEAALADVLAISSEPRYGAMLESVRAILNDLRAAAATTTPDTTGS